MASKSTKVLIFGGFVGFFGILMSQQPQTTEPLTSYMFWLGMACVMLCVLGITINIVSPKKAENHRAANQMASNKEANLEMPEWMKNFKAFFPQNTVGSRTSGYGSTTFKKGRCYPIGGYDANSKTVMVCEGSYQYCVSEDQIRYA